MYEQKLFASKTHPNIVTVDQFLFDLWSKQMLSQTNFKLLHNIINNDTDMKTKLFQEQQEQKIKIRAHVQKLRRNIH